MRRVLPKGAPSHEAEIEAARKAELQWQAEAQAREDAQLLHSVGQGVLSAAAILLSDLIDADTGAPKRPTNPRDIQPLTRAGIECLAAASGQTPEGTDPNAGLREALDSAPGDVRDTVLRALRSLAEWRESSEGRR